MIIALPQRRAMGFGAPMASAEIDAWAGDVVNLFLNGCRGWRARRADRRRTRTLGAGALGGPRDYHRLHARASISQLRSAGRSPHRRTARAFARRGPGQGARAGGRPQSARLEDPRRPCAPAFRSSGRRRAAWAPISPARSSPSAKAPMRGGSASSVFGSLPPFGREGALADLLVVSDERVLPIPDDARRRAGGCAAGRGRHRAPGADRRGARRPGTSAC